MPNGNGNLNRQSDASLKLEALMLEALVMKASEGDKEALCKLCEKVAKGVLFQVTYILGKPDGVEDVSQEVLVRICENIHKLRNPKAFKAWLSRIIINEKNRYLAKNMKQGEVLDIEDFMEKETEESGEFIPQHYLENKELREKVREIIIELPMRQRETIIMHYYDGLSVTEIAKVLDVTTQSVSKNLAIARAKLKKELDMEGHDEEFYIGSSMAMLPVGFVLTEILRRESASFMAEEAQVQGIMASYAQSVLYTVTQMFGLPLTVLVTLVGAYLTAAMALVTKRMLNRHC